MYGFDEWSGQTLELRVAVPQGLLACAKRFLGLLALDDLSFERAPLPLQAVDALGGDAACGSQEQHTAGKQGAHRRQVIALTCGKRPHDICAPQTRANGSVGRINRK
jgi:hypothetical protein